MKSFGQRECLTEPAKLESQNAYGNNSSFDWSGTVVLVTGGSGFKGAWLAYILAELGARVYATISTSIHPESAYSYLKLHDRVSCLTVDITDIDAVNRMIAQIQPRVVFHLAAKSQVTVALKAPRIAFDINVMGTINLMEACRQVRSCERFLFCSTDHVFGPLADPRKLPFTEDSPVSFGGPYDTSKAATELIVRCYQNTYREELPNICITRCANVFGFGDVCARRVIPALMQAGFRDGIVPVTVRETGRQFIPVADAVSGYIIAVMHLTGVLGPEQAVPTYHFALEDYSDMVDSHEPFIRMKVLASRVAEIVGAVVAESSDCMDHRPNENPYQGLSCAQTRAQLDWQPMYGFREALEETVMWYCPGVNDARRRHMIRDATTRAASHIKP